ncbi:MAG: hypothetical protein WBW69_04420 [Candidatus Korobacteraceae bacterium]
MQKNNVVLDDAPAPAITPEMISKIKKEDMQQAVVERFSGEAAAKRKATKIRKR